MSKTLSIIVPSYNMEKFLPYCLDSLLVENHRDLLEVLVVNDGSNDGTLRVAREYTDRYPELIRVIDKKNGNYGSCINAALPVAMGKYVKILDADDSFDTANFDEFLGFLSRSDADLVLSDYEIINEKREHVRTVHYGFRINGSVPYANVCADKVFIDEIQMHAIAYRRTMLLDMGYRQTEGVSYTDQQWIFTPMIYVNTIAYFGKTVYRYLVGRVGQTMDPKVKARSMEHARINSFGLVSDFEAHRPNIRSMAVREYLYSRLAWYIKDIYVFYIMHFNGGNAPILRKYDENLRNLSREVYEMIGSKEVSSFAGFPYIAFLRRYRFPMIFGKMIGAMYTVMDRLRAKKVIANGVR